MDNKIFKKLKMFFFMSTSQKLGYIPWNPLLYKDSIAPLALYAHPIPREFCMGCRSLKKTKFIVHGEEEASI